MDKSRIVAVLEEIAILLELKGENAFRCNAYRNAARAIDQLDESLATILAEKRLDQVRGIGETLRDKITTLVETGSLPFHDELRKATPPGLLAMLRIPGLGPKKVKALHENLSIKDLSELEAACMSGAVAVLKGFGEKAQQKILEGIQFLSQVGARVRLDEAWELAQRLMAGLRSCSDIIRMEVCGSLRRRKETIGDIDILVSAKIVDAIMERFVSLPGVKKILARGETKASVLVALREEMEDPVLQADLRVVRDDQFPFALHYFTGSKEHNVAVRGRAQEYELKLNEYELVGPKKSVACKDEADLFRALDLDYIPPELRENTGEIEAAAAHALPRLMEASDLRGVFHCHSKWSDGQATIEDMAKAAKKLGYEYLGMADHSQSLTVANGLSVERVRLQHAEIDALNAKLKGFRLFKGIECDILADGSLDYADDVLATFDYVVASVHSHFNQSLDEMTARIVRAVSHPSVTMLGHSTGRLLLRREGYKVDLEKVLTAAATHGTMVEINANPYRLDLDWVHCKRAKRLGVTLVINPDAHSTDDIEFTAYGVDVARKGWLEAKDVFNTKGVEEVEKSLLARRKKG